MKKSITTHIEPINGNDMYYEIHGQGEPLLLLHGFTGSSANWAALGEEWIADFKTIIPDMRGHGRSTSTSTFTLRQVALDMFALLDRLNIKNFKAVGSSGGASVLLHMATQQPDRVEAMVLVSATSYYPEQTRALMRQSSTDTLTQQEWDALRQLHPRGDDQIRELYKQVHSFAETYDDVNFTSSNLSTISARTLLVQGDKDPLYPIDITINMYKAIPQCNLWIIPNAGHVPISGKTIDQFINICEEYLKTTKTT